jgi:hypothetical protein
MEQIKRVWLTLTTLNKHFHHTLIVAKLNKTVIITTLITKFANSKTSKDSTIKNIKSSILLPI